VSASMSILVAALELRLKACAQAPLTYSAVPTTPARLLMAQENVCRLALAQIHLSLDIALDPLTSSAVSVVAFPLPALVLT